jgi:uncharacterized RmlC-like cupin family protein
MESMAKEEKMGRKLMWMLMVAGVILITGAYVGNVQATQPSGFSASTIAKGRFEDIDASNHTFFPDGFLPQPFNKNWLSFQKTVGPSDLYVQSNTWAPGGTTGWHSHPGHSLIIVTAGTVTAYEGDDPACTAHVYTVGMGFVDRGGDHVHVVRNEGSIEARTIAVQLIPADAMRRIDANGSAACPF